MTHTDPAASAVLFDIDGTLIDSNYLHVDAWSRAFEHLKHPVDAWRIHGSIGMDSAVMFETLLGARAEELGSEAKRLHSKYIAENAARLRPFKDSRELLRAVAATGVQVVLATSAPKEELTRLLKVLDCDDAVSHVTSADDVGQAKPAPAILRAALRKASATPEHAIMVGDSVWDIEACNRAGIPCVAVLTGGTADADLRDAGAVAVYDDVAALLAELQGSPLAALWG